MANPFSIGDVVRVKEPEDFISAFATKIRDRDAVVVGYATWHPDTHVIVEFQKRNGRGQVFQERMHVRAFFLVRSAESSKEAK